MAITAGYQVFLRNHQKLWLWRSGAAEFFRFFEDKISLQPWVGSLKFLTFSEMVGTEPATWITWIGVHAFPPMDCLKGTYQDHPHGAPNIPSRLASLRRRTHRRVMGGDHGSDSWISSVRWGILDGQFPEAMGKSWEKAHETIGNYWKLVDLFIHWRIVFRFWARKIS